LAPVDDPGAVQIALWVAKGFEGKGIGTRIAATMEQYAFEVFGYSRLYYQHDALNESSKRLPQKLGYRFSHTFEEDITAEDETGFWMSWVKDRPIDLEPGLLQGAPMEQFNEIRHL
jgi:RimJ/RimL family protein N-acetyltransferase